MNFQQLASELKGFEGLYYWRIETHPTEVVYRLSNGSYYKLSLLEEQHNLIFCSYGRDEKIDCYLAFAGDLVFQYENQNHDMYVAKRRAGSINGEEIPQRDWNKKAKRYAMRFRTFLQTHPSIRLRILF